MEKSCIVRVIDHVARKTYQKKVRIFSYNPIVVPEQICTVAGERIKENHLRRGNCSIGYQSSNDDINYWRELPC
ncbi:MAG: hypothetical protein LBT48_05735 [Prevotellaceae bacterium]|nr:hypothetical protein [Prevotellaceae bacterium]